MRVFSRIVRSGLIWCILCGGITAARAQELSEANEPAWVKPVPSYQHKIEGTWFGYLDALNIKYTIILRMRQKPDRTMMGTLYCPDIRANDISVEKITFEEDSLQFEIKDLVAVFEGKLNEDGSAIEGQWKQSGFVLPLIVKRISEAELDKLLKDKSYTKIFSPNKLREDLDFLFKTIEEVHPNMYAYTSKGSFSKLRDQLYSQSSKPMSRLEFYKAIAPVVAFLKNGHTFMQLPRGAFEEYLQKGGKIFPLECYWDGTSMILKSCASGDDLPIGSEILAIDNQNAKEFLVRTTRYFPAENKPYNLGLLESENTLPMLLWLEKGNAESMTISIKTMDGVIEKYVIKPLSKTEIENQVTANETKDTTASSDKNPNYSYRCIPEHNVGLIEFNSCSGLEKFEAFLVETFDKIQEQIPDNLIIDIRKNSGGQSSLGDEFLEYLTDKPFRQFEKIELKVSKQVCEQYNSLGMHESEGQIGSMKSYEGGFEQPEENPLRFKGQLFLLIGPKTASSAMSFAAAVKHFGIGNLIGRETEDTPVNYGECIMGSLPNTGLGFSVACKRFVQAGGVENGRGVIPDCEVKQTPKDTAKGVDTVLQFTLDLIRKSSSEIPEQEERSQI
jgi:C-terminal processing protease CtpA/Prc